MRVYEPFVPSPWVTNPRLQVCCFWVLTFWPRASACLDAELIVDIPETDLRPSVVTLKYDKKVSETNVSETRL